MSDIAPAVPSVTGILPESAKDNCKEKPTRRIDSDRFCCDQASGAFGQKMAGLRVGTVGGEPTVRVARPGLGTGAVILGGGDCQRCLPCGANHVPRKSAANSGNSCRAFFLFLQGKYPTRVQTDLVSTERRSFCKLRGRRCRSVESSHTASHPRNTRAGASRVCNRRNALPAQRSSFRISSRPARPSSSIRSRTTRISSSACMSSPMEFDKST